jgi:homoserine O-acetyltransferase
MNHLLSTVDISTEELSAVEVAASITSQIHIVTVDSDLLFTAHQSHLNYQELKGRKKEVFYHEIESIHGHDAILIEYPKLSKILQQIF